MPVVEKVRRRGASPAVWIGGVLIAPVLALVVLIVVVWSRPRGSILEVGSYTVIASPHAGKALPGGAATLREALSTRVGKAPFTHTLRHIPSMRRSRPTSVREAC